MDVQYSFLDSKGTLNSVICNAHFSDNFNSVFNRKIEKIFCVCAVNHIKKGRADWILRIFSFNNKNSFYLSLTLTLQGSKLSGRDKISRKTIWQTSNIKKSEFK